MPEIMPPICPYCQKPSAKVSGALIYSGRTDLYQRKYFWCQPCDAYVGCHEATGKPLGQLANEELRTLRVRLHRHFDQLWERRYGKAYGTRSEAYAWLAKRLGMSKQACHFGMMNETQCINALQVVREKLDEAV